MKYLLIFGILITTTFLGYASAEERSIDTEEVPVYTGTTKYISSSEFFDFEESEYIIFDGVSSETQANKSAIGIAGGLFGGMIGALLISKIMIATSDCENDTEEDLCRGITGLRGAIIGLPIGAILGSNIAVSYSDVNKATTISTSFNF